MFISISTSRGLHNVICEYFLQHVPVLPLSWVSPVEICTTNSSKKMRKKDNETQRINVTCKIPRFRHSTIFYWISFSEITFKISLHIRLNFSNWTTSHNPRLVELVWREQHLDINLINPWTRSYVWGLNFNIRRCQVAICQWPENCAKISLHTSTPVSIV